MGQSEIGLSDESAEDLVEMTTWADDPEITRQARTELWQRFRPYVYVACVRAYGREMRPKDIHDLVVDTFVRAFERAGTFRNENLADKDRAHRKVGAWLCAIARRLAIDRKHTGEMSFVDPDHLERARPPGKPSGQLGPLAQKVREALASPGVLSVKQIVVLREWAVHYDPERNQQRLPDGVTADLARQLNVQPESIRQILHRGLRRLQTWLENDQRLAGAKTQ